MKYKGKIMRTERNLVHVPTEGSRVSLQQTHSAAMSLQVEGEEDEQRWIRQTLIKTKNKVRFFKKKL